MKDAITWKEIKWECPHCGAINELDVWEGTKITNMIEMCPECEKDVKLNDT